MDLSTLSRPGGKPAGDVSPTTGTGRVPRPRSRWVTRLLLPAAILLATLATMAYAARDWLAPAESVRAVRAIALSASPSDARVDAEQAGEPGGEAAMPRPAAEVVAQAPGWVEPDPYPIYVTGLAEGVVERVEVLEGEAVKAGQPLVRLVAEDAVLDLQRAEAELARREAAATAARIDYEEPVSLRRAEAVARARLAGAEAARVRLDAEVAREAAKLAELEAELTRLTTVAERSVSALQVDAARYGVQSQRAAVEATRQRRPGLEAAVDAAEAEFEAAARDLELKTTLRRMRDEAAASVEDARAAVEEAELRLSRMVIRSPVDGVVMDRLIVPGDKLTLGGGGRHTAHVMHLYDPESLQVRVDVPLVDAASVGLGQRAIVVVDVLPDEEFTGVVTRVVHKADIAKNTVQFKVAIEDPSPLLKPDMLARVKFLSEAERSGPVSPIATSGEAPATPVAIRPSALVRPGGEAGDVFVWWISPIDDRIERRDVAVGGMLDGEMAWIRSGLNPGDLVVDRPAETLRPGQRVRVIEAAGASGGRLEGAAR